MPFRTPKVRVLCTFDQILDRVLQQGEEADADPRLEVIDFHQEGSRITPLVRQIELETLFTANRPEVMRLFKDAGPGQEFHEWIIQRV